MIHEVNAIPGQSQGLIPAKHEDPAGQAWGLSLQRREREVGSVQEGNRLFLRRGDHHMVKGTFSASRFQIQKPSSGLVRQGKNPLLAPDRQPLRHVST